MIPTKKVWNYNTLYELMSKKVWNSSKSLEFQVVMSKRVWNSKCGHVMEFQHPL